MAESYSTFDIMRVFSLKIDRIKDWISRGYIVPSIQRANGRGTKSLFGRNDLYLIGLFIALARITSRGNAKRIVEVFRGNKELWKLDDWSSNADMVGIGVYPRGVKGSVDWLIDWLLNRGH